MPASVDLQELITAVVEAVVAAQTQIEHRQTDILRQYFDSNGRPISMSLQLPALGSDTNATEATLLAVPLIAIIPPSLLHIAAVSIEFDVGLGALDQPAMPLRLGAFAASVSSGAPLDVPNIRVPDTDMPDSEVPKVEVPGDPGSLRGAEPAAAPASQSSKALTVGLQPPTSESGGRATIHLKVESQPQTEGLARLISQISQRF